MSEKLDLAELFSLLEKTTEEYIASPSFKRLEQEIEVVKHIEKYRLPEVNKLISCSSVLADCEWTQRYNSIRALYSAANSFDVLDLLLKYKSDCTSFEEKILSVAGFDIIKKIALYFQNVERELERDKKERSSLKGKITKAKKKRQEEQGNDLSILGNNAKNEDELRIEELDKIIEEKDKKLKSFKNHYQLTIKYLDKYENKEQMSVLREQAYAAIDEIKPPREEEFLLEYVESGQLSDKNIEELKNYGFVQRFLECLNKERYRNFALPVLSKLYEDGAIDFEDELIGQFVNTNPRLLAEFLEDRYNQNASFLIDGNNDILIEYAVKSSISGCNDYVTWWNTLKAPDDWKVILTKIKVIFGCPIELNVAKILHHVEGKSLGAFMELLNSTDLVEIDFSSSEFISEYLGQEAPDARDLVRGYIRNSEQSNRKLLRRLASRERELNRFSSDLFSSIYLPVEQLENLAVNLRLSDGEIKCSLVAGQMIQAISSLREGLAVMGLETADEIDNWQSQSLVAYDVEKHRMSSPVVNQEEKVKLQTLGYAYVDDEGNRKVRAAEVYIPAPIEEKDEIDNGNAHFSCKRGNHRVNIQGRDKNQKKKGYPQNGSRNNKKGKFKKIHRKNHRGKGNKK